MGTVGKASSYNNIFLFDCFLNFINNIVLSDSYVRTSCPRGLPAAIVEFLWPNVDYSRMSRKILLLPSKNSVAFSGIRWTPWFVAEGSRVKPNGRNVDAAMWVCLRLQWHLLRPVSWCSGALAGRNRNYPSSGKGADWAGSMENQVNSGGTDFFWCIAVNQECACQ